VKLFNTLGRQLQEFKPLQPGQVSLYSCGPTVYSYYHVGNLRNAVFNDTLRRALQANGYQVNHIVNITDVGHLTSDADEGEDKLEKGAASEGRTVWQVAEFYTEAFKKDVAQLNVLPPNAHSGAKDNYARATDFIPQQIELVKSLLDKGFAYQTEQAIYFDVTKLPDYGHLTGQKLADKEVAARPDVVTDAAKHHPQDFAVWFFASGHFEGHTMRWPSPWGEGFPGWHLECSAIIHATLGDPIDIHTGAVDLIGTHHTNEMAQTEAAYGNQLANYWVHNEYLLVDGQKMAKSLGNAYNLADIKAKGFDPLALRLLYLQAHYRSQLNFTWESLQAAQNFLNRLCDWADLKFQPAADKPGGQGQSYDAAIDKMKTALADDLNSAEALGYLSDLAAQSEEQGVAASQLQSALERIDELLGLGLAQRQDVDDQIKSLLDQRQKARQASDWHAADELRQKLSDLKIAVSDTPAGQLWRRTA